jgi:CheY-like chemotaxis protein
MRILVIDDDADFARHLSVAGCEEMTITAVHETLAAFELLRFRQFDGVVLDLSMDPVLAPRRVDEGLAVLGAIRGGHRGSVPVVIATESADDEAEVWCYRLGAFAVIRKAQGLTSVVDAVRTAINSAPTSGVQTRGHEAPDVNRHRT